MIAAIHQPNFFPWLGYFQKIAKADLLVVLDAVPVQKTGSTWVNRTRLLIGGEPRWASCPILRPHGTELINQVKIDDVQPWRKKLLHSLQTNYGKARFFSTVMEWLEPIITRPVCDLSEFNLLNIVEIAHRLGLECQYVEQSKLSDPIISASRGSERLAAICRELGADTYLSGDGADGYEDLSTYEKVNVRVVRNNFRAQAYPQIGSTNFVPGLSIIDALLNIGPERTRDILREGAQQ